MPSVARFAVLQLRLAVVGLLLLRVAGPLVRMVVVGLLLLQFSGP